MMEFLYFPEDKTEYIPAVISLLIFAIGAVIVMRWIISVNKKQEQRAEEEFGQTGEHSVSQEDSKDKEEFK
ncbi:MULTISPECIES: hypothetical protein [Pontibacillus]|uniref:Uncharacterized protein n=1 Tax=Pontibacillus chungwhensis TaxID=265426 RepID=A0ABY8UVM2_9BACI|nr:MULTISPECIES: hypothetical protein [Pontibacillus]MCD5325135.1 hypothetical protein [Pontibacillus sp. HN14]WIF97385.1 hypothetical protein QNI29_16860 [Pontibacillus chungwhensis]